MLGKTNAQRKILLTSEEITPTKSQQIITTPEDYDGLSEVTVNAIPDNYIDTSEGNATAAQILSGKKAYVDGSLITGTMTNRGNVGVKTLNATTTSYTIPAGYHNGSGKVQHSTATQATPTISVDSSGLITASSTQSAGYVSSGTKSATKQLTTQATKIWTPTTIDQTIAAGTYLTGTQTIKGDANLRAENIKSDVSIFGVDGSLESGAEVVYERINLTSVSQTIQLTNILREPKMIFFCQFGAYMQQWNDPNILIRGLISYRSNASIMSKIWYTSIETSLGNEVVKSCIIYDASTQKLNIDFTKHTTTHYGFGPIPYYFDIAY